MVSASKDLWAWLTLAAHFPSSTGDAEQNETTQHYQTVAELSSKDLSDEPAKQAIDDESNIYTMATATQD